MLIKYLVVRGQERALNPATHYTVSVVRKLLDKIKHMKGLWIIFVVITACTRPTETTSETADTTRIDSTNEPMTVQTDGQETFPDFVKNINLPDSILIDVDHVIYGDFNADEKEDFASIVTNLENGFQGVLIIHNKDIQEYIVFGAGQEINGMKNLNWIDIFRTIPKGKIIAPTLVDAETGDIIGDDKTKEFRLLGNGIFMHVDEAGGGGILFWTGDKYEWYHLE